MSGLELRMRTLRSWGADIGPKFVAAFTQDVPLKLASLVLALLLWFAIAAAKTSEIGLSASLELQNVPPELELTGEAVNTVDVRLRASPGLIRQLERGEVAAQVDLAGAREGERIVHLTADSIRTPFGFQVVKITPASVTLHLERTLQKSLPVQPRFLGVPREGYELAEIKSEPAEVKVAGPKSRIEDASTAFTEPVSIEGVDTTVSQEVTIGVADPLLRIQGSPSARVTARVRETHERRVFEAVPVTVRGGTAALQPAVVRVAVEGPGRLLKDLKPDDLHPYVDVSSLQGARALPVSVDKGEGLADVTARPAPAEVLARKTPERPVQ